MTTLIVQYTVRYEQLHHNQHMKPTQGSNLEHRSVPLDTDIWFLHPSNSSTKVPTSDIPDLSLYMHNHNLKEYITAPHMQLHSQNQTKDIAGAL